MRNKSYCILLFFLISGTLMPTKSVMAQQIPTNITELTDEQVQRIIDEIKDRGLTQEQAIQLAKTRGVSQQQIEQIIIRINEIETEEFEQQKDSTTKQLGKKRPLNIPFWLAKILAVSGDILGTKAPINSLKLEKITQSITFSSKKAKKELYWEPLSVLKNLKIS